MTTPSEEAKKRAMKAEELIASIIIDSQPQWNPGVTPWRKVREAISEATGLTELMEACEQMADLIEKRAGCRDWFEIELAQKARAALTPKQQEPSK